MVGQQLLGEPDPERRASTDESARTFISPKPGSEPIRFFSSAAVVHAAPDVRRLAAEVLDDGLGEILDACRHRAGEAVDRRLLPERASSADGSVAAIFPGSSVPSRCFRRSGPANACWTVICWSSAKPTSSANGSSASSLHAASSSVNQRASGG